jgi:cytochrome b
MSATRFQDVAVWDPAVRVFHWTLAGSFLVAYFTEDELMALHVNAGYLIGALILFRLIWGFAGPAHARFRDFVRGPSAVRDYLRQAVRFDAPRHLGHNPAGGAMVLALLITLTVTVLSGIALYGATDFAGPLAGLFRGELAADLLEETHEVAANLTLLLVVLHLVGVLFSSLEHGENLVKAMITGRKKSEVAP